MHLLLFQKKKKKVQKFSRSCYAWTWRYILASEAHSLTLTYPLLISIGSINVTQKLMSPSLIFFPPILTQGSCHHSCTSINSCTLECFKPLLAFTYRGKDVFCPFFPTAGPKTLSSLNPQTIPCIPPLFYFPRFK